MRKLIATALFLSASGALADGPPAGQPLPFMQAKLSCEALMGLDISGIGGGGSHITSAVAAQVNGVSACVVDGILAPSIQFRVQMPQISWSQRYLQVGCGGLCGRVSLEAGAADGCIPLSAGEFVIAATDMGHQGMDPSFGRDAQQRTDFAYRGVHLTALAAKALTNAFYGQTPRYSYFTGCSDGGREALMEAQRYPDDFDGIIAGAPAMIFQVQNSMHHGWLAGANTGAGGQPILFASRLKLLHEAVLKSCDGLDGQMDGLLTDPRLCTFDPASIQCAAGAPDTSTCLTAEEVAVVQKFYAGPRDEKTGTALVVGALQRGSELAWQGVSVPADGQTSVFSGMVAMQAMQNLIFEPELPDSFTLADFRFDLTTFEKLRARHPLLDATNPDLSAFVAHGGKLIQWHGWSDPHISPITSIAYHEALQAQMGREAVQDFSRLYMLPGVFHCGQGEGPDKVDFLSAIMNWVELGVAPDALITRQNASAGSSFGQPASAPPGAPPQVEGPARSRPLYPYPEVALYNGTGDPMSAASYHRAPPLYDRPVGDWAGSSFFKPYTAREE